MGNRLSIIKKDNLLGDQDLRELGKRALRERDALLAERPDLIEFQREIDRILDGAGGFENRMAVLAVMMEAHLKELQKRISRLSFISDGISETKNRKNPLSSEA